MFLYVFLYQGWARNVKARDRDGPKTASSAETRLRRDVKISRRDRDATFVALETWSRVKMLKYKFYWLQ